MSSNTPTHLKGIEGDLSKYNNTLYKIPGYSQESFNAYVKEYSDYFKETGNDPVLSYAKTQLYNELGDEEYNKNGYSKYGNLDSLLRHFHKEGVPYENTQIDAEDSEETELPDTVRDFSIDSSMVDNSPVPTFENLAIKSDEEIFGNNHITTKSFSEMHPEYNNIDLNSKVSLPGISDNEGLTITTKEGSVFNLAKVGSFAANANKEAADKLNHVEQLAAQGMDINHAAKMLNPNIPEYDYIDMLQDIKGSEEKELSYIQENTAEAIKHYMKEGASESMSEEELYSMAEQEVHRRILNLEDRIREKTSFAMLDATRKDEIVRQYEIDKYMYDNPTIGEDEGAYLFSTLDNNSGKSIDEASNDILDRLVNGSYTKEQSSVDGTTTATDVTVDTQKYLRMFDKMASDISPYYADFHNMGESFMSSKDKLKVMSKFLVLSRTNGTEAALEYLRDNLPQFDGTPEISNGMKFLRTWGQQTLSTGYSLWGIVDGTMDWVAGKSPAPKGSGWFDRWMWSIGSTDAAQKAQLMSDTGVFVGLGKDDNYNLALKMQRYGANAHDLSDNKFLEFMANQGYTAVTMLYSAGASGLVSGASKAAGKTISSAASKLATQSAFKWAGKVTEEIATKWAGRLLAAGILPAVTAGNEALMEGNTAYKQAVQRGTAAIDKLIEESLKSDLAMDDQGNFLNEEVAEFFRDKTYDIQSEIDLLVDELSTVPETEQEYYSRASKVDRLNELYAQLQKEYPLIAEEYKNYKYGEAIDKAKHAIEVEAVNAYASTVALDAAIITTCDVFFSSILGPSVGKLLGKLGVVSDKALVTQVSKNIADGFKPTPYNTVSRILGNSVSEGVEEHTMVMNREGTLGLANSNLEKFFYNTVDPTSEEALGYNMFTSMAAVGKAVGNAAISKEAWEAFGMGALGALVGSLNTNVTTVGRELESNLKVAENWFEKSMAVANAIWRNPIAYETLNRRQHINRANAATSYVNEVLEKNPELASAFQSAKGVASYTNDFFNAKNRGDYVDAEDAEFGMFVSGANILSKLKDTAVGRAYKQYIKDILKTDANSEEGKSLIENFISKLSDAERAKYEDDPSLALEEVKNRVKKYQELQSSVNSVMQDIDNTYGNLIDERTKESIAFVYLAKDDMKNRIKSREDIIKGALQNEVFANSERSSLTEEQKAAVAEYGSLENAQKVLSILSKNKAHRSDIKKVRKAISALKSVGENSLLLGAADIMALKPIERASILSSENFDLYSNEQKNVIRAIKSAGISKEVFTAIEDAGKLQDRLDTNDSIINKLENSDLNLFRLNTTLVKNATIRNANVKTELLKQAESYEDFKNGLDALIASGKLTTNEQAILGTSVFTDKKTKDFYMRYSMGKRVKESTNKLIDQMKPVSSDRRSKAVIDAVLRSLSDRMTSFKDRFNFDAASNLFLEGPFLQTLKDVYGINWEAVTDSDKAAILSEVKRAIDIANIAVSNREEVLQRYNESHPITRFERAVNKSKLFNDVIYTKGKAIYDAIFDKIVRINNGENISLTALEMYQLASLMDKNLFVAPLDVDSTLFKGMTVDITSFKSLDKLYDSLESRKSMYEDSFSVYMQFIHGLGLLLSKAKNNPMGTITAGIIELNSDYKDKFDKKIQKESKDKVKKGVKFDKKTKIVKLNIIPDGSPFLTEAQKEWYRSNNIAANIMNVNDNIPRRQVRTVLIKDPSLFESEVTYDSDNLPMAVAVKVGKSFPNAVLIDGNYYAYVGICENSRSNVTEEVNILNAIRESALNDFNEEGPKVITYSDSGTPVEFGGLNYNISYSDGDTITSVKEKLLKKYSHITNYEDRIEAAYNDFCENTVEVQKSVVIETVTQEVDGETVTKRLPKVYWTYNWKGQQYQKEFWAEEGEYSMDSESKLLAYIMPNPESSNNPIVNIVFSNLYDLTYTADDNTIGIRGIYDNIMDGSMNLFDYRYADTTLAFLHNCLNDLKSEIAAGKIRRDLKVTGINKEAAQRNAAEKISEKLQGIISGYLNTKPKGMPAAIQYSVNIENDNITVFLRNPNLPDKSAILDTVSISVDEFLKSEKPLDVFFQDIVFKTFYDPQLDSFREHEYDGEMIPLVKLQINYTKFDGTPNKERQKKSDKEDKRRGIFLSNVLHTDGLWSSRELTSVSSTIVEEKKPADPKEVIEKGKRHKEIDIVPPTDSTVTVEQAMNTLLNFKQTPQSRGEARASGHMGVTTFISEGEKKEKNRMTASEVLPFELGTSLDYVVRRFLEYGKDPEKTYKVIYDAYKQLTVDTKFCPIQGLNWTELRAFIDNISTLVEFFESRGETIVPFDTLFTGTLTSSDGKFAKLTAIPDIITIDRNGDLHIYDMKSYRAVDTMVKMPSFGPDGVFVARGSYFNESIGLDNGGNINHENGSFQKQTSAYAHIIGNATGLRVASVGIIPIPLYYDVDKDNLRRSDGEIDIQGLNVYQLSYSNGSQFRLKRVPSFYKDAIKLPILPIDKLSSDKWSLPEDPIPTVVEDGPDDIIPPTGNTGSAEGIAPSLTEKAEGPKPVKLELAPGFTGMDPELQRMLEECGGEDLGF